MNKSKQKIIFAIALLAVFFVANKSTNAASETFDVTEDTFINEAYPNNNYGSAGSIVISNEPIDRYGFLQFEDVSLPEDAVVDEINFEFYAYDHSLSEDGWLRIGLIGGSDWEENEPKWSGPYPGPLTSAGNYTELNLDLSTGWKEVDVTDFVSKWISGEKDQRGLYIYPSGSDDFTLSLRSKEHGSNAASLEIEYHVEEEEYDFDLESPEDGDTLAKSRPTFEWSEIDEDSDIDDYLIIVEKLTDDGIDTEKVIEEKISEDNTTYTIEEDLEEGEYTWHMEALDDDENSIYETESWEFSVDFSGDEDADNEDTEDIGDDDIPSGPFGFSDTSSDEEDPQQGDESQDEALQEEKGSSVWSNLLFLFIGIAIAAAAYFGFLEVKKRKKTKKAADVQTKEKENEL